MDINFLNNKKEKNISVGKNDEAKVKWSNVDKKEEKINIPKKSFLRPKKQEEMESDKITKQEYQKNVKKNSKPTEKKVENSEKFQSSDLIKTNLLKDELIVSLDWKKNVITLAIFVIMSLTFLGGIYWGLLYLEQQKKAEIDSITNLFINIDSQVKDIEGEIKEVLIFKDKLSLVKGMLDKHIYWTNFFELLEENTLSEVYYLDFSSNSEGEYELEAVANGYDIIEAQVKKMKKNKYIKNIEVSKAQILESDDNYINMVEFNIKIAIDKNLFTD